MGDFNHGHIQWESVKSAGGDDHQFLLLTQDCFLTEHVLETTRGGNVLILSSQNELVDNVKVHEHLGDQIHFNLKVKTGNTYKKQWRRNFNKGKYKEMRTYLANIDWNNLLKNKTETECWTCLKFEIEGIIEKFVPLRKQGKRSRKKHLSKEAITKIAHKQMLWRVYKHSGNVEDYTNYKEAINLAITEIRKSKRTSEKNWQVI